MEVTKMSDEKMIEETVTPSEEKVETKVETAAPADAAAMAEVIHDPNAPVVTVRKLLEAGVHFGHQTRRWNPKMAKYIYGARNNIYLIDLIKTAELVKVAYEKLRDIVKDGGKVLFVGTKPAAQQIIIDEATRSGSFYITNRWLGGTLTNFRTILSRTKYLKELQAMAEDGSLEKLPKKEIAAKKKEMEKLSKNLEGIKEMRRLPQALVVADPSLEHNAVSEARKLNIPVFAICDTSDDPDLITYPLPSNNDGQAAIRLMIGLMADAVCEGKGGLPVYSYIPLEGEDATMPDAVKAADIANEQRKAAIRAQRKEREERYLKMQQERAARFVKKNAQKAEEKPAEKAEVKAEEAGKEEVKA